MGSNKFDELHDVALLSNARIRHDIRASLAISKGMCQALEMSLEHLSEACAIDTPEERLNSLETIEKDCRFCLSRILSSLTQLDSTVEAAIARATSVAKSDTQGTA